MRKLSIYIALFLLMAIGIYAYNTDNIIAYYDFQNFSGNDIIDLTGHNNNLTILFGSAGHIHTTTDGKIDNGVYFDIDQRHLVSTTFPNIKYSDGISYNIWVKFNTTPNGDTFNNAEVFAFQGSNSQLLMTEFKQTTSRIYYHYGGTFNYYMNITGMPSSNVWHMITWTYHKGSQSATLYIDGVLNKSAFINPQPLNSSGTLNSTIMDCAFSKCDEMLIYNGTLSPNDILTLYNSGNGLNYTELFNETIANITEGRCVSEHEFCYNPIWIGNKYACYANDTAYCSVYCDNITNTCDNGICENACNIIEARKCYSTASYSICEDINADGCLEWLDGIECSAGEYCLASGNYFAACVTASSTATINNNTGFSVTPYATNLIKSTDYNYTFRQKVILNTIIGLNPVFTTLSLFGIIKIPDGYYINNTFTVYKNDQINKIVTVDTELIGHLQAFSINANNNTYTSRTCDYKEELYYQNNNIQANSTSNATNIIETIGSNARIEINTLINDNIQTRIYVVSSLSAILNQYMLLRNSTNKEICIYVGNTDIFVACNIGNQAYDDLTTVDIIFNYDFASSQYTASFKFNRINTETITTNAILFVPNDINAIILESNNSTLNTIKVITETEGTGFVTTRPLDYDFLPCAYTKKGIYTVRTYINNKGDIDYSNYYDYVVNINSLASNDAVASSEHSKEGFFSSLLNIDSSTTQSQKSWVGILLIFALAIITIITIWATTGSGGFSALMGGIVASVLLVIFTVIGMFPAWILILIIIFAAGVVMLMGRKLIYGD